MNAARESHHPAGAGTVQGATPVRQRYARSLVLVLYGVAMALVATAYVAVARGPWAGSAVGSAGLDLIAAAGIVLALGWYVVGPIFDRR